MNTVIRPDGSWYMSADLSHDEERVEFRFAAHDKVITFDRKALAQLIPILQNLAESTMKPQFEFEQQLLDCWGVLDDIQCVIDNCDDDVVLNTLIGIKQLYQFKFDKLWNLFEQVCFEKT